MAAEEYKILIQDETSGGDEMGSGQASPQEEQKKTNTLLGDVAKFFGSMIGLTSAITFIIQALRRSKILSTFMDSLLTTLSAVIDLLLIPLIPIFIPVLHLITSFIPVAAKINTEISEFLKDPWGKLIEWLGGSESIFGKALNEVRTIWGSTGEEIGKIWADEGLSFWDKVGGTASIVWGNIEATASVAFSAISDWWGTTIAPKIEEFSKNLPEDWSGFINVASTEVESVFKTLGDIWGDPETTTWQKIVGSAITVWESVKTVWSYFWNQGPGHTLWQTVTTTISNWWTSLWSDGGKGLSAWESVQETIGNFWTGTVVPAATKFWGEQILPYVEKAWENIQITAMPVIIKIAEIIDVVHRGAVTLFNAVVTFIKFIDSLNPFLNFNEPDYMFEPASLADKLTVDYNNMLTDQRNKDIAMQQNIARGGVYNAATNSMTYGGPSSSVVIEEINVVVNNNNAVGELSSEEASTFVSKAMLDAMLRI